LTPPPRLDFTLAETVEAIIKQVQAIEAWATGFDPETAGALALVAEEVLVNIHKNAWPAGAHGRCAVALTTERRDDGLAIVMTTRDDGMAFDPLAAAAPDVDSGLDDRALGGLGIFLVREMTDTQSYRREAGWNVLVLEKLCLIG
jgi:anti-sigma regulatory factor (Ser/Thr protein kinase)